MIATPQVRDPAYHLRRIEAVPVDRLAVDAVDLAKLIAVSESTIRRWTASGTIPSVLIGSVRIYPLEHIRQWLAEMVSSPCAAQRQEASQS
ncbi:MAG: helix-turn-helix domain-containing protein [Pirellulales bacterium]|nr:helix-turn-helix domain-containing protein [Pirellulales bacterium]